MSFASRICSWSIVWVLLFTTCAPAFAARQSDTSLPLRVRQTAVTPATTAVPQPERKPGIITKQGWDDPADSILPAAKSVAAQQEAWEDILCVNEPSRERNPYATLLDGSGALTSVVTSKSKEAWARAVELPESLETESGRWAAIWLAELDISRLEPEAAREQLRELIPHLPIASRERGLALFDHALATCMSGRYREAEQEFERLLASDQPGFDRIYAANLRQHARVKSAFHKRNEKAGITQPASIDPLAGAAVIAIALKKLGRPYDKSKVLPRVPRTGLGTSQAQMQQAAEAVGLTGRWLSASPEGIRSLFRLNGGLPLAAWVEHNHYIALTAADKSGVTYWCVDCGEWPGGEKRLTWQQWKLMECDRVFVIARRSSAFAEAISLLQDRRETRPAVPGPTPPPGQGITAPAQRILSQLTSVSAVGYFSSVFADGLMPQAHQCGCTDPCAEASKECPPGGVSHPDPVNLANLSMSYGPEPDLTVYNPRGPDVSWGHRYQSHARIVPNGYGMGWSHPYLYTIDVLPFSTNGESYDGFQGTNHPRLRHPNSSLTTLGGTYTVTPSASNPTLELTVPDGEPYHVRWQWNATASVDEFVMTNLDRSTWTFRRVNQGPNQLFRVAYYPVMIADRDGNFITLSWSQMSFVGFNPINNSYFGNCAGLNQIKDDQGAVLLDLTYSSGKLTTATDYRSGRKVHYEVTTIATNNPRVQDLTSNWELTAVSQITHNASAPAKYTYQYSMFRNHDVVPPITEELPILWRASMPSPQNNGQTSVFEVGHSFEQGYLVYQKDANGIYKRFSSAPGASNTTVKTYNSEAHYASDVTNQVDTSVSSYTMTYDSQMRKTGLLNAAGQTVVTWVYGGSNTGTPKRPSQVILNFSATESKTWSFAHNKYNQLTYSLTPKGVATEIDYSTGTPSVLPQPIESRTINGTTTIVGARYYYYPNGLVSYVESGIPEGKSTPGSPAPLQTSVSYEYDTLANVTKVTTVGTGSGQTRIWNLNYTTDGQYTQSAKRGQPVRITDPRGKVTSLRYDSDGNLTTLIDPALRTATATYNPESLDVDSVSVPGPSGGTVTTTYSYQYPGGPLLQVSTNGSPSRTVQYVYGKEGEVLEVRDPNGGSQQVLGQYAYDANYNVRQFADGKGGTTTWYRNADQQVTEVRYPGYTSGSADRVTYVSDRAGRTTQSTDGRGQTSTFTYGDADGLLTSVAVSGQTVSLAYDALDRTTSITDPTGTSTSEYDDIGNLLKSIRTYTGRPSRTFDYEYFADGSREKMITPWGTWTYAYNEIGAPDQMTSPAGTVNYEYFDDGALASREVLNTSGNSVAFTNYEYNSAGLLKKLENKTSSNGSQLSLFDMTASAAYDGAFNLKSLAATVVGSPTLSGTLGWDYDTRDRVTSEAGTRPGLMGSASYDGADNLLTKGANGWTYNANNQVTPSSGQWAYDGNGNATKFRTRDCTFDPFDRMTTMRDGNNWSVGYTYRADGLMATRAKTVYIYEDEIGSWMPLTEAPTYFYHDGGEPVVELSSTNEVKAINVRGPDGLVARKHGSNWIYYTFDQQGSVSQRLNSNGVVQSTSAYSAYGSEVNSGTPTDPFGYCAQWGYWLDRDTGLYLCQARWYDPVTGRWVNRDPIGYAGGANLYGYCAGRPVGSADPSGLLEMFGFDFNGETIGNGLRTGLAGLASAFTFGAYDGGDYKCQPGFEFAAGSGAVAREALIAAGTAGIGNYISAARAARAAAAAAAASKATAATKIGGNALAKGGVYVLEDAAGNVKYVGRTNNFIRRAAEHGSSAKKGLRMRRIYGTDDVFEQTVLEQQLMKAEREKGAQLLNKYNAISSKNPLWKYLQ